MLCVCRIVVLSLFVLGAFLLNSATSASAQSTNFSKPMAKDAYVARYDYEQFGKVLLAVMITPVNGKVAVCGFWTEEKKMRSYGKTTGLNNKALGASSVRLGKKRLIGGLTFMKQVPIEKFESGHPARCRLTSVAWQKGYSNKLVDVKSARIRTYE